MANPRSGMTAQIGYRAESTYGTYVAPTRFVPLVSESLKLEKAKIESAGIIPGRRTLDSTHRTSGIKTVSGSIQHELYAANVAILFEHMLGAVITSGAGPYTHTITPGDLFGKSLTVQVGRPGAGGTVHPFSYTGCKITKAEIAGKVGEIATLGLDVVGKNETTAQSLATASIPAMVPLKFLGSTCSVGGSAAKIREFTLGIETPMDTERRDGTGDGTIDEPIENDLRVFTLDLLLEFVDLTDYNRFVNDTEAAVSIALAAGTHSVTLAGNAQFDGETPGVNGRKVLEQPLKTRLVGTTDAAALTATIVNGDSTP